MIARYEPPPFPPSPTTAYDPMRSPRRGMRPPPPRDGGRGKKGVEGGMEVVTAAHSHSSVEWSKEEERRRDASRLFHPSALEEEEGGSGRGEGEGGEGGLRQSCKRRRRRGMNRPREETTDDSGIPSKAWD